MNTRKAGALKLDLVELYRKKSRLGLDHKIRLFLKKEEDVYCFVEGKDSEYYYPKIQAHTEKKISFFDSNGRENVIRIHDIIQKIKKFSNYKILYFIDKDFNADVISEAIYQTPCYSIENLYVHKSVVSSILEYSWHIEKEDIEKAIALYEAAQNKYHLHALEINTFIKLQKRLSKEKKQSINLNLNNINLDHVYKINLEKVEKKIELSQLVLRFDEIIEYEDTQFQNTQQTFTERNYCYEFRGKNELFFLKKYLERLKEELGKKTISEYFSKRYKITGQVDEIMSTYSQYAEYPECMKFYINRIVGK